MKPRVSINNYILAVVVLFFVLLVGMLMKARYRLPSETTIVAPIAEIEVPRAVPVAIPVDEAVQETRDYKQGDWWVLPRPSLIVSRANEADTLRIRSGSKEDVFVLYFVDAAETSWIRPSRLHEQSNYFHKAPVERVMDSGNEARTWVSQLLRDHPFKLYTKWGKVPDTERYYAFITVEAEPGKQFDLGEMLVRRGFAMPLGLQTKLLPDILPPLDRYKAMLGKALAMAKSERVGAWAFAPEALPKL